MKKIIFFSLEDGWLGGVASVNLALQPALREQGYEVKNLFLRGCRFGCEEREGDVTLRPHSPWEFVSGSEIKAELYRGKLRSALSLGGKRLLHEWHNRVDFRKARAYLVKENPDAIIVSSYLLLPAIPPALHARTLHHVHTSFSATIAQKANRDMLLRYNGKIGFLWLSRSICEKATAEGFQHSFYVYNPLSHYPQERTEAEKKRKIAIITRFSPEKRLPLAVSLLKEAMDRLPRKDAFQVEFWGTGPEEDALRRAIGEDPRFTLCGQTRTPFQILKESRLTLNTSSFEGFSISILEAAAAGVPCISFRFGEAAEEEIINGKTGILLPMDENKAFADALLSLLSDDTLCASLSQGAREHAEAFRAPVIAGAWEALLSRLPLDKSLKSV